MPPQRHSDDDRRERHRHVELDDDGQHDDHAVDDGGHERLDDGHDQQRHDGQRRHDGHGLDDRHGVDGRDGHGLDERDDQQRYDERAGRLDVRESGHGRRLRFDERQHDDIEVMLRHLALVLAAAASLSLAACHRGSEADEHSTASNPVPKGATGRGAAGTAEMGGPGAGLTGGMAPASAAGQATGVAEGSTNRTTKGSVGNR